MGNLSVVRGRGRGTGFEGASEQWKCARRAGHKLWTPSRGHHPLPGRQGLLRHRPEGMIQVSPTFPSVVSTGCTELSHTPQAGTQIGGDGLELGEVLSSSAPTWENGKTPLRIDSWE